MPKTMLVKAKPGLRIPYPENSHKYLEGDEPAAVDVDSYERLEYWTRRVMHDEAEELTGDAVKLHAEKAKAARAKEEAAEKKSAEESQAARKASLEDAKRVVEPETMVVKKSDGHKETV